MGNQLAGIAPSQILSVESYFSDIHDFEYDKSLGSTRFFKVARAKHREGLVVVKVFAIQDPTLPLTSYKQELEELKIRLHSAQNCLPFQKAAEKASEKAAMLFRQYVRDNLYDRISTRPFLNNIEKRWIAFQILTAVDQAHKSGVRHGDIKTENVMVTSWNWVLLTDFASFKPTYLPEDNPADFNYFFDTSRRRTCYIAPERFVDGGMFATELEYMRDPSTPLVDLNSNQRTRGELKRAMDIFSAENIALLAETALRFLELVQLKTLNMENDPDSEEVDEATHPNGDYDTGVAAYVGWQSSSILKPLLQQGLSDAEEFVIVKALNALTCMCQLGLLQKPHVYEFASDIAPFLCHPNLWIRYGAVGFITVVAHQISTADVYCKLMPYLDPYITQPVIQIERKLVLLSVLKEPVSRSIFDYALRSKDITSLFRHLHMRQKKRHGSILDCPPPEDPAIAQLLKKLLSQGMTEEEEDKLLALKDFMMKSNRAKANAVDQSHLHDSSQKGVIDLAALGITGRQVDLVKTKQEPDEKRG
ncbi:hypothetical protein A6R68_09295 [Neotoma lepida]|uniref:Protein kinase domain-containing protein n=1 Tax=Neotoma lepida TaxID=56216 RepID=A0A1A6G067_NEOLE|nr:hypothetical protein A6R68_09295 [Neotoma lepida]